MQLNWTQVLCNYWTLSSRLEVLKVLNTRKQIQEVEEEKGEGDRSSRTGKGTRAPGPLASTEFSSGRLMTPSLVFDGSLCTAQRNFRGSRQYLPTPSLLVELPVALTMNTPMTSSSWNSAYQEPIIPITLWISSANKNCSNTLNPWHLQFNLHC